MKRTVIPLSALLCLFLSIHSFSQEIDEREVPMKLVMKHYSLYNHCNITQWKHYDEEDGSYTVDFVLNENKMSTTYSSTGIRIQEDVILSVIHSNVHDFLDATYSKFKIYKLIRVSKFKHGRVDLVYHKLLYSANKEIHAKFFDASFSMLNQSNFDHIASN